MNLLCITDLHGEWDLLEQILARQTENDLIVLGGDLTNFGTPDEAKRIVRRAQAAAPRVVAVAGNCDSPAIDERLAELGVSVFRRGVVHDGVGFYGVSAMPPWHGTMYELSEEEITAALQVGRSQIGAVDREVLVSHPPPWGLADTTRRGDHVGSRAVREWIERHPPALVVCGHIHEARGSERFGPTQIVNCGPAMAGSYAVVRLGEEVEVALKRI